MIVNLDEFSELCGKTAETMRVHMRSVEGSPVWLVERGDRGRGYKIEAEGGLAWWKARCDAEQNASAERQQQLQQLRFDHLGDAAESKEALALSGKARNDEYAAVLTRIKLRQTMGQLVDVGEIEGPATSAVIELRRRLLQVAPEFAVEAGLSPDQVKPLHAMLERAVNAFLDGLPSPLTPVASDA